MIAGVLPDGFATAGIGPSLVVTALLGCAAVLALTGRSRLRTSRALVPRAGWGDADPVDLGTGREERGRIGQGSVSRGPGSAYGARSSGGRGARTIAGEGLRDTAMMLELIAAMLDAGAGIGKALEMVAACAAPHIRASLRPVVAALAIGTDWETAWRSSAGLPRDVANLKQALGFAALTGAPSAAILYAQAARSRRERFRDAEQRAAALGVKLVVPLGLCSLPAFICLGVVPVLLAMMPSGF